MAPAWAEPGALQTQFRFHGPKGLRVTASLDETLNHGDLMHVSISYPKHYPSWSDIKEVRTVFFEPRIDVMMVLPREGDYVNLHQNCFHLWETPTEWGIQ